MISSMRSESYARSNYFDTSSMRMSGTQDNIAEMHVHAMIRAHDAPMTCDRIARVQL
jgi:hypothetical protein